MAYACRVLFPAAGKEVYAVNVKETQHIYQAGSTCVFLRVSQGSTVVQFSSTAGKHNLHINHSVPTILKINVTTALLYTIMAA